MHPPAPPAPRASRRHRWLWPLVGLLALAVVALSVTLVVLRDHDGRPSASPGDLYDYPFQEDDLAHYGEVYLPWVRLRVAAGDVRDELPDVLGARANVQAPEGGSFVRVDLDVADDGLIPLTAVAAPFQQQTDVVLRADGREYPLLGPGGPTLDPNGPLGQGGSTWVAVDGEPDELEVEVTVDGLTQTVDASDGSVDNGRAAELADVSQRAAGVDRDAGTPCGTPRRLDDTDLRLSYGRPLECRVRLALRTPYVDGLGWADEGREYVSVQLVQPVRVLLVNGRGADRVYWDAGMEVDVRLGDAEPLGPPVAVNSLDRGSLALSDPGNPGQRVFDVAAGEPLDDLTITLTSDATLGEPFPTDRRTAVFQWTVAGEDLP